MGCGAADTPSSHVIGGPWRPQGGTSGRRAHQPGCGARRLAAQQLQQTTLLLLLLLLDGATHDDDDCQSKHIELKVHISDLASLASFLRIAYSC